MRNNTSVIRWTFRKSFGRWISSTARNIITYQNNRYEDKIQTLIAKAFLINIDGRLHVSIKFEYYQAALLRPLLLRERSLATLHCQILILKVFCSFYFPYCPSIQNENDNFSANDFVIEFIVFIFTHKTTKLSGMDCGIKNLLTSINKRLRRKFLYNCNTL